MVQSHDIKNMAKKYGADACNIASVSDFNDAPKGFHPQDILPAATSIALFLCKFPKHCLHSKNMAPYTFIRNEMVKKIDRITFELCCELETNDIVSIPIPCDEPYDYWNKERREGRSIISLKHAAVIAGLGLLGKNTLLIHQIYGNMIWLGGILIADELDPDTPTEHKECDPECTLCLDSCPVNALDGTTIIQKRCREHSITCSEGGGMIYTCNTCRIVCPYFDGNPTLK